MSQSRTSNERLIEFIEEFTPRHPTAKDAISLMRRMGKDWFTDYQLRMICDDLINSHRSAQRLHRSNRQLQRAG